MVRHQMGISDEHCCADSDVIIFRHLRRLLRYMAPMGVLQMGDQSFAPCTTHLDWFHPLLEYVSKVCNFV